MKFCSGAVLTKAICEVTQSGQDDLYLIVSYWGEGGLDRIGLAKPQKRQINILCDLTSGSCNPSEIKRILKRKDIALRHRRHLHAKVYCSDAAAVVSSANASKNGHGIDGVSEAGLLEAGIYVSKSKAHAEIQKWSKGQWSQGLKITPALLAECESAWMTNKIKSGQVGQVHSLSELLKADRGLLAKSRVFVAWYEYDPDDPDDMKALAELKKLENLLGSKLEYWADYEDPRIYRSGDIHISAVVRVKADGSVRAEVEGIYQVVRDTKKLSSGTFFTPLIRRRSFFVSGLKVGMTQSDKQITAHRLEELVRMKPAATEGLSQLSKFFK